LEQINNSISTRANLKSVPNVKSSNVRGVFAIKVSRCVPERFSFARRFWSPLGCQARRGLSGDKKQTATTQARLPLFILRQAFAPLLK
jgi:hypothetical protein